MGDVVYVVMCGSTHTVIDELTSEFLAVDVALAHDQVHRCSPWGAVPARARPP